MEVTRLGCRVKEALGVVLCLAGSTSLGISGHLWGEPGTCGSLISSPRRAVSSSGVGEVPCSSPVGSRREASSMLSTLWVIRGSMHF